MRGSVEVKHDLETFPSLNSVIKWKHLKTGGKIEEKRQRIAGGREQQKSAFAINEKVTAGAARAEAYKRVLSLKTQRSKGRHRQSTLTWEMGKGGNLLSVMMVLLRVVADCWRPRLETQPQPQRTHNNQPKPNQGRSWVPPSLRRFKKIHIQIITDAICIVIVVAWLAVFVCFGLLFFILFMLLVFVFVFAHLCLCLCLVFAVCVYCARAVCFLLRCRVYVGTPYASACAMYMHMPREIRIVRNSE